MSDKKINLVAIDMGYGHQRAAYPLLDLSAGEVVTVNDYPGILDWEKKYWLDTQKSYEKISRFQKIPVFGRLVFKTMDFFQQIQPFYPNRDLSKPTLQQRYFYHSIKKGLGKRMVEQLDSELPFVTTFFVAAYMAEYHNYQGDIYCIVCDMDASRAWAPIRAKSSRIKYFLPNQKLKERFLMYGVREENLFITGFPLPKENIGDRGEILRDDLACRLQALDPERKYYEKYEGLLNDYLSNSESSVRTSPLSLTFAVGGAGAQKEIGITILKKLSEKICSKKIKINLIAGTRPEVKEYFKKTILELGLSEGVEIIFSPRKNDYFRLFNSCLRKTDILWTKPSELSFYTALGVPIIISAPVGSQEEYNRETLIASGAGIDSLSPEYVNEWLFDLVSSGQLARAAMDGFLNIESRGTYNIEKFFNK